MKKIINNESGVILIMSFFVITIISLLLFASSKRSLVDAKINRSFLSSKKAFFLSMSGIAHAKEILRLKSLEDNFSNELKFAASKDNKINIDFNSGDDIPIISNELTGGSYSVYLLNDFKDGLRNTYDTNGTVILRSLGTEASGEEKNLEVTVKRSIAYSLMDFKSTVTLLGEGSLVKLNKVGKNILSGNEKYNCGIMSKSIFSVFGKKTYKNINKKIEISKNNIYITEDIFGPVETISLSILYDFLDKYKLDINRVKDIKKIGVAIKKGSDLVVSNIKSSKMINMGDKKSPKIVYARGNFLLESNGFGILFVEGTLYIQGKVKYEGLIIAIGNGVIKILGDERKEISGSLILANIVNPKLEKNNTLFLEDNKPGKAVFDISDGNNIIIERCTDNVKNALAQIPLESVSFCDERCIEQRFLKKQVFKK